MSDTNHTAVQRTHLSTKTRKQETKSYWLLGSLKLVGNSQHVWNVIIQDVNAVVEQPRPTYTLGTFTLLIDSCCGCVLRLAICHLQKHLLSGRLE